MNTVNEVGTDRHILRMPNMPNGAIGECDIPHAGVVVIVGANGSGKTRLGAWLENPAVRRHQESNFHTDTKRNEDIYRISARRSLELPPSAVRKSLAEANAELNSGLGGAMGTGTRHTRVGGDPIVGAVGDYGALINALFSARTSAALSYLEEGKASNFGPGKADKDDLDRLKEIWERIFPGRELLIGDHVLAARNSSEEDSYAAPLMSDGERVGLYLIGSVLLTPPKSKIVIDEPEVHLHEAIQSVLWNELESARRDCCFVYLTHSIAFAASRVGAKRIALLDYRAPKSVKELDSGASSSSATVGMPSPGMKQVVREGVWIWRDVLPPDDLPIELALKLLGSRRPVLFVEGKAGGLDQKFFELVYSDYLVVPCDNWQKVVDCVKGFRRQGALHHLKVRGLIDRDDRPESEVAALIRNGVYVLPVGAIECLYILPECLESCARTVEGGSDAVVRDAKDRVMEEVRRHKAYVISERAQYAIRYALQRIDRKGDSLDDLKAAVEYVVNKADVSGSYDQAQSAIDAALAGGYVEALVVFRNKSLIDVAAGAFKLTAAAYCACILTLLAANESDLCARVRERLPKLD